jgi:glycosyltransferase involved in cell wall biosynthesis
MSTTVSVVIPVYNGAAFIARAIDSALEQSHRPTEVIVVNDGSTDATLDVLAAYRGRIRLLSIANGGVSNARNLGMQASTGELIAFLDADDSWHPNKLQLQVAAMRAYPRAALCCCDYVVLDKHLGHVVNHFSACKKGMTYDRPFDQGLVAALIQCNFVGTASTVILRRALCQQVGGFNVAYRQAEDYDYWLRCAALAPFIVLSARLMEKRSHATNLTNDGLETLQCHERVLQDLPRNAALGDADLDRIAPALAHLRHDIGRLLFEQGDYRMGARYCALAVASHGSPAVLGRVASLFLKKTARLLAWHKSTPPGLSPSSFSHTRAD